MSERLHYLKPLIFTSCRQSDIPGLLQEIRETLAVAKTPALLKNCVQTLGKCPWSSESQELSDQILARLQQIQQAFQDQTGRLAFPLDADSSQRVDELIQAWQTLAAAYSNWLKTATGLRNRARASLMVRLFDSLRQILGCHYFWHWQLPENLWRDLHELYRFAIDQALVSIAVKQPGVYHGRRLTLENRYKQSLLLGLADPYGLMPEEQSLLEPLLEKWSSVVQLKTPSGPGWQIDLEDDVPATWVEEEIGTQIDFSKLIRLLKDLRELASPAGRFEFWDLAEKDSLSVELLRKLVEAWQAPPEQASESFLPPRGHLICGFKPIFQQLLEGQVPQTIAATLRSGWYECRAQAGALKIGDLLAMEGRGGNLRLYVLDKLILPAQDPATPAIKLTPLLDQLKPVGVQPLLSEIKPRVYQRGLWGLREDTPVLLIEQQRVEEGLQVRLLEADKTSLVRLEKKRNPARGVLEFVCISGAGGA